MTNFFGVSIAGITSAFQEFDARAPISMKRSQELFFNVLFYSFL
jgi:hypothetical protein